ncbi:hypothetical protein IAU60_001207 [Kwoniella sp. DSM 27419]
MPRLTAAWRRAVAGGEFAVEPPVEEPLVEDEAPEPWHHPPFRPALRWQQEQWERLNSSLSDPTAWARMASSQESGQGEGEGRGGSDDLPGEPWADAEPEIGRRATPPRDPFWDDPSLMDLEFQPDAEATPMPRRASIQGDVRGLGQGFTTTSSSSHDGDFSSLSDGEVQRRNNQRERDRRVVKRQSIHGMGILSDELSVGLSRSNPLTAEPPTEQDAAGESQRFRLGAEGQAGSTTLWERSGPDVDRAKDKAVAKALAKKALSDKVDSQGKQIDDLVTALDRLDLNVPTVLAHRDPESVTVVRHDPRDPVVRAKELAEVAARVSAIEGQNVLLPGVVDRARAELLRLLATVNQLHTVEGVDKVDQKVVALAQQVATTDGAVTSLTTATGVSTITQDVTTIRTSLATLSQAQDTHAREQKTLAEGHSTLSKAQDTLLSNDQQSLSDKIRTVTTSNTVLSHTVDTLNTSHTTLSQSVDTLQNTLALAQVDVTACQQRVDHLEGSLYNPDDTVVRITDLLSPLLNLSTSISRLGYRADGLNARADELNTRADQLDTRADGLGTSLRDQGNGLSARLVTIEQAIPQGVSPNDQLAPSSTVTALASRVDTREREIPPQNPVLAPDPLQRRSDLVLLRHPLIQRNPREVVCITTASVNAPVQDIIWQLLQRVNKLENPLDGVDIQYLGIGPGDDCFKTLWYDFHALAHPFRQDELRFLGLEDSRTPLKTALFSVINQANRLERG